ncbi:MAG: DUF1016 family protein [Sphingobacteriales bacterium]|nr:MAG: DUF1016 family protein [Sphingobacteriales bacterium]
MCYNYPPSWGQLGLAQKSGDLVFIPQVGGQTPEAIILCSQIPWKHNVTIIQKIKNQAEAYFYIEQTIENNWSRAVL